MLEAEAADFMATLMHVSLPEPEGRLRIPIVTTDEKIALGDQNAPVSRFLKECCEFKEGARIAKKDVFTRYQEFCQENEFASLSIVEFGRQLKEFTGGKVKAGVKVESQGGKRGDGYVGLALAT
jgi:phage/plasmid-associated DNA primase